MPSLTPALRRTPTGARCDAVSLFRSEHHLRLFPSLSLLRCSKVACETAAKTGMIMIFGEITTKATVDYEKVRERAA